MVITEVTQLLGDDRLGLMALMHYPPHLCQPTYKTIKRLKQNPWHDSNIVSTLFTSVHHMPFKLLIISLEDLHHSERENDIRELVLYQVNSTSNSFETPLSQCHYQSYICWLLHDKLVFFFKIIYVSQRGISFLIINEAFVANVTSYMVSLKHLNIHTKWATALRTINDRSITWLKWYNGIFMNVSEWDKKPTYFLIYFFENLYEDNTKT